MVRSLSVVTWNCFGMAQRALDAITAARAPHRERLFDGEVKTTLDDAHVVCIQELLSEDAVAFFDALGQVRVRDDNAARLRPMSLRGSGLGIAGRLPLAAARLRTFASPRAGWDRLARKGTLYARIGCDGVEVDVLNVHLQAGYGPVASTIRALQIEELGRDVQELGSSDRPFIVAGDFNVCGLGQRGAAYEHLRRMLDGFEDLGAAEDLPTFDPHPERNSLAHLIEPKSPCQRVDYIFVRSARNAAVHTREVRRVFDRPLRSSQTSWASDHYGLSATLDIVAR